MKAERRKDEQEQAMFKVFVRRWLADIGFNGAVLCFDPRFKTAARRAFVLEAADAAGGNWVGCHCKCGLR